jgi:hypothetical protein
MISWIQKYFQKHFRLVMFVVLIAVAVPMVVVYNQSSGSLGRADRGLGPRPYFHLDLNNEEQVRRAAQDAQYSAELKGIYVPQYAFLHRGRGRQIHQRTRPLPQCRGQVRCAALRRFR